MNTAYFGWPMVRTTCSLYDGLGLLRVATVDEIEQHGLQYGDVLNLDDSVTRSNEPCK